MIYLNIIDLYINLKHIMTYILTKDQALSFEESIFKSSRLPLFLKKYKSTFWDFDDSRKDFLIEISWVFNLFKYKSNWKWYYSSKEKIEKKEYFIKKIIEEYWLTEIKANEKYYDLYNIYEDVYKDLVSWISSFRLIKYTVIWVILMVLLIISLIFLEDFLTPILWNFLTNKLTSIIIWVTVIFFVFKSGAFWK